MARKVTHFLVGLPDSNMAIGILLLAATVVTITACLLNKLPAKQSAGSAFESTFHGQLVDAVRKVNVGEIPCGGLTPFQFEIRNISDAAVRLSQGPSSCSCVVSKLSADTLQPGKSATIAGTVEGGFQNGPKAQSFLIRVESAEHRKSVDATPVREEVMFLILGNICVEKGLHPSTVRAKLTRKTAEVLRRPFSVFWPAPRDAQLEVESADLPSGVRLELAPPHDHESGSVAFPGTLIIDPAGLATDTDHFHGFATFRLKSSALAHPPLFIMHVVVDIVNGVLVIPNFVSWSKADSYSTVTLRLETADGVDVEIADLDFERNLISCREVPSKADEKNLTLECLVKNPATIIRSQLRIVVRSRQSEEPITITVPILIL